MKCLAMRLGEEFQDRADVVLLLKTVGVRNMQVVETILARYYSLDRFPARALYVLEELLSESPSA